MTPVHLAIRVPVASLRQVVVEHNKVVAREGKVLLAKFGASPGAANIQRLHAQATRDAPFSLILVGWKAGHVQGYVAPIAELFTGDPLAGLLHLVPAYYPKLAPGLWVVLAGPFAVQSLEPYVLASNKRSLLDVLGASRTPSMLVEAAA